MASGDLLVQRRDVEDSEPNYHVVVDRSYNSLADSAFSILSPRWGFDVGPQTKIVDAGATVRLTGPSGYMVTFARQSDGSYNAPAGFDGTLVASNGGWMLHRTSVGDDFRFDASGRLTATRDAQGRDFTVQGTSAAGRDVLSSYGTNSGRRANLSYTGDSLVRELDDPASGHIYYSYSAGHLSDVQLANGRHESYGYDSTGHLNRITAADGAVTTITSDSAGRVTALTVTAPGGTAQTTSFDYSRSGRTTVTDPSGKHRTYVYDQDFRVVKQFDFDETPPASPHDFLADFDEDTGEADVDWLSEDPTGPDGTAGTGVVAYEYRYRRQGQAWSALTTTAEPGFRFPNATLGELVDIEVTAIDLADNRSALATASVAVGSVGDCQQDPLADDAIDASTHVNDAGTSVDAFTFDTPKAAADVRSALPAGTKVVSLLERDPGTDVDTQTSAMSLKASMTWDQNVAFWNEVVRDDTDDFVDYLQSARGTANATDQEVIDRQLQSLDERKQSFAAYGGVPVRSFAIEHDPVASQQITDHFAGDLQKARTSSTQDEHSEGCPTVNLTGARAAAQQRTLAAPQQQTALARSTVTGEDGSSGPAETGIRRGSYSPFHIRVATYEKASRVPTDGGDARSFHKVVAAWRFGASSNRYYWFRGYRRNDIPRGVEVQVDMNKDHSGHSFGAPLWGFLPPPSDGHTESGIPDVWTASYRCAYPDDYLNDDVYHGYSLTIGMGCRPRSNRFRYRWAQLVTNLDAHDGLQASVQPVHYAQDDHKVPGSFLGYGNELAYCKAKQRRGSCYFGDHGVANVNYTHTTDGRSLLTTPGQAVFERG